MLRTLLFQAVSTSTPQISLFKFVALRIVSVGCERAKVIQWTPPILLQTGTHSADQCRFDVQAWAHNIERVKLAAEFRTYKKKCRKKSGT